MDLVNITNIQGYSIHDGPGIRTVVFFKGCPLRCQWCANPENLLPQSQVGFLSKLCHSCGRCAAHCPENAIVPGEGTYRIDRTRCTNCGNCVEACLYEALVRYGKPMTADEVFRKVRRDKMFYDSSGGGVTVSGGEPMIYATFVEELFTKCRNEGISTCIETCGYAPEEHFRRLIPLTDFFCFDLKLMDDALHQTYTGRSNALILQNARIVAASGAEVLFRQPLIPGINDTHDNIARTASFLKELPAGRQKLQLMPYHRAGQSKYDALAMINTTAAVKVMDASAIRAVMEEYTALGISCSISK